MEQEDKNAVLFASFKSGNEAAREKLIIQNLPLVKHIASRFYSEVSEADDLFQEGCIGLIKAVENYNPERGTKFSSYAVPYIVGEIRSFLRRSRNMFKVSRSFYEHYRQLHRKIIELEQKLKRKPRLEELVTALQISREEIAWLLEFKPPALAFDTEGFILQSEDYASKENSTIESYLQKLALTNKINSLPSRERQIIVLRYIMGKTQAETAAILGLSQAHVSRLERKLLLQMKKDIDEL